jgi:hypothetical protein
MTVGGVADTGTPPTPGKNRIVEESKADFFSCFQGERARKDAARLTEDGEHPVSLSPPTVVATLSACSAWRRDGRFLIVWLILLGGLLVGAATSDLLSRGEWFALLIGLYYGPFKIAALIGLSRGERQRLTWQRLLAYFLWVGIQPRPFLLGYSPPHNQPIPTWAGFLLNLATGILLLWGVPWLFPPGTPLMVRAWTGLIGLGFLRLLAGFDLLALIFQRIGFPVEKAWVNPLGATSLRDFWGRRWNRIMSGGLRDLVFTPLTRHVGVVVAALVVFLYSGLVHEFVSVLAQSGAGRPTLYFLLQGAAFLLEGTRLGRRFLVGNVGRCWTALVVIGPVGLVVSPKLLELVVPVLREMSVPGLGE